MKTALFTTLIVCLMLAATFFTTQTLMKEESKRTRTAIANMLEAHAPASPDQADATPERLDTLNSQLANLSRRMTVLEEAVAVAAKSSEVITPLRNDLSALRQDVKLLTTAQTQLGTIPGYLADLSRYLDQSFAHVEQIVTGGADDAPEKLATSVDELTQRLDMVEHLFVPLYDAFGSSLISDGVQPIPIPLDERLDKLSEQLDSVRQDIQELRKWMTPRNIGTDERAPAILP